VEDGVHWNGVFVMVFDGEWCMTNNYDMLL